jgi:phosphoglycolate phosphatase-like HAD superfamily hydrolase
MDQLADLLQNVKAIIFDFDGVILESGNIKTEAFLELFSAYPQHREAILNYHLANLGLSRFDKFDWIYRELLGQPLGEIECAKLGDSFSAIVLDKVLNCSFVPGALETLQALRGQLPMFVASGTPQAELDLIVERRGLAQYFDRVWGSPSKKAQIIEQVLGEYHLPREQVLFIGDGSSDYEAASKAGILFVARDTPEMNAKWMELSVLGIHDLYSLIRVHSSNGLIVTSKAASLGK